MGDVIKEVVIDRFDGGISEDLRAQVKNQFAISQLFDIYSNPNRLTPHRTLEADSNDGSTATGMKQYDVQDYWVSSVSGRLYALGQQAAFSRPKVFYKVEGDIAAGNWTLPATAEGGALLVRGCFFEWAGAMWMFSGTVNLSKWTIGSTFTDAALTLGQTASEVSQGIISPTDNKAYTFYYAAATDRSYVVSIDSAGSPTDNVLNLPIGYRVRSSCLWGNYIAIALSTNTTVARSIVILWDPTLSNFSEIIDFGDGTINVLENVEGSLCAIMDGAMSTSLSTTGGTLNVRMWSGGSVQTVKTIKQNAAISSGIFKKQKTLKDFRVYFVATLSFNGTAFPSTGYAGIWCFGRKGPGQPFAITCDTTDSNIAISNGVNGFAIVGDFRFITINNDGSIYKSNDQPVGGYTGTSMLESQKYNCGGLQKRKLLHSVFVNTVPLPSAGQIILKYRKDEETSYTTLFTETTDNNISTELGAASGVALPEFKEIQFRLESTGFAEPVSWGFRFTELDSATTPE